jgi:hypothetical protein
MIIIFFKHPHYLKLLFSKESEEFKEDSVVHKIICTTVAPTYREEYFGYRYFVLPVYGFKTMMIDSKFRVYGVVRLNNECLILYKGDVIKTMICLDDKRHSEVILEDLRIIYRNILLVALTGGVIFWQVYLKFMI